MRHLRVSRALFMDVEAFLESIRCDPAYAGQIVHVHFEPGTAACWADIPSGLHPGACQFLRVQGIDRLYLHQAEAIAAALDGDDVLITTPSASGKSLCYQLALLDATLRDPNATGLLVFPAKALAHDQMASWNHGIAALHEHIDPSRIIARAFDADADAADRRRARESGRVLVTNPEMLHMNLLPYHGRWARFLTGLRFVVLDEVHTYSGFFGANMANVLRRLERICRHYGARPQFICSSATVANPVEMVECLTGRTPRHVSSDCSVTGGRTYVFWNPPRIKTRRWRGRRSSNVEAHELMVRLIRERISCLCFSKARNTAEMIYRYVRDGLRECAPGLVGRVMPYRGGYSPAERRAMERRLRDGELLGVSATRALELGIDVGMLDACITVGYPGALNAFFQQAGRCGRGGRDALCILVGTDTPINQYVMQHPEFIFERPVERGVIDRDNPFVVLGHLRCAAAELPVREGELDAFGYAAQFTMDVLAADAKVCSAQAAWYHASSDQPAHAVRLRGYGDESTVVMDADQGKVIDRVDKFRALRIFYPGAIYFHRGDTYAMEHHDTERNVVFVRRKDVSYYTDPVTGTAVDNVDLVLDQRPLGTGTAFLGEVFAVLDTPLYERVRFYTLDRISQHPLEGLRTSYEAMSFWLTTPPDLPARVARLGLDPDSGMRGILYCVSRILPLFLTSDANDFDWSLGCRNVPWHTMFWYEFYLRGIGHSEQCFERLEDILSVTLEHLLTCDCDDGCPNCTSRLITPYHVRNIELGEGIVASRRAAVVILNSLLTAQSAEQSMALLDAHRPRRGMAFLPTVVGQPQLREPHRTPLGDRTRRLLFRKLKRDEEMKEALDHPIASTPPTQPKQRPEKRSLHRKAANVKDKPAAIQRKSDPLSRKLRAQLESSSPGTKPPANGSQQSPALARPARSASTPSPTDGRLVTAGDPVARRALKRKREDTESGARTGEGANS